MANLKGDLYFPADSRKVRFRYRNHRGEIGVRLVRIQGIFFGATHWYPGVKQWFLDCDDCDKNAVREFALNNIILGDGDKTISDLMMPKAIHPIKVMPGDI